MSITNALLTGVSGLNANSERVNGISSNIANANTIGYRRTFSSFVTDNAADRQAGVSAVSRADVSRSGSLQATGRLQDFAVSGEGFFVVSRRPNDPVASNFFLTRAGSFQPDADGNLRNSAGYYLNGFPADALIGTAPVDRSTVGDLSTVNISQFQIAGSPSTRIGISGNLPAQSTGVAEPGDAFVSTTRYVDQLGGAAELKIRWQPTDTASEWVLSVSGPDGTDYGNATVQFADSGPKAGAPLSFTSNGLPIDPATGIVTLSIDNGTAPQSLELDFGAPDGFSGMTQFSGDFTAPSFSNDGSETGSLVRAEMGPNGVLFGLFDNGQRRALFEVPLAEVPSANLMRSIDGNVYLPTVESGSMTLSRSGTGSVGTIEAGVLEASNVDIAQELTDLIQTQRAYSSNAKIVTTADEMLDETLRIKR